jgi:2-isopropylmalate synthase
LDAPMAAVRYVEHHLFEEDGEAGTKPQQGIRLTVDVRGETVQLVGTGNGPIDAAVHALHAIGMQVQVRSYEERSIKASTDGGDAQACAFLELVPSGGGAERFGVGMDTNIVTASIQALLSGVNRLGLVSQSAPDALAAA